MNVLELLDAPLASEPGLVYLFCPGKPPRGRDATFEAFLADRAVAKLVDAYVDPANKEFGLVTFYADETDAGTVVGEAQTLPFLAERRVVVVRNAERYATESAAGPLLSYLADPSPSTVLLLVADKIDKRTKFYKGCKDAAEIVECPELNERELMQWMRGETAALGRKVEDAAMREILTRAGTRLSDVNNALTLAIEFAGEDAKQITDEHVRAACADVAEEEIWALTDAIAASQTGKALHALRRLSALGKHPDEIIGTINWLIKSAYAAERNDPSLSSFVAKKVRPLATKLGAAKLPAAFALCTDAQFMMRTTGVDGALALELLVLKLAHPRGRAV